MSWLFKAKRYYGLQVLNYTVTSNHIHLLVYADERRWAIPRSMQLTAGRTGWEYNRRKNRRGAFWEDSYHATAIQSDRHLFECMVYIDLNMVRAGVVSHPSEWRFGGFHELMNCRQRYRLIDINKLSDLMGEHNIETMRVAYCRMVNAALEKQCLRREEQWTDSIAVGTEAFIKEMKERLGQRARYRFATENKRSWILNEEVA
jgi:putative transposase